MRLVSAQTPARFSEVVAAQCGNDRSLFLAHSDGSISQYSEDHQLVCAWLNPGKRVTCLASLDTRLFIAFNDRTARVVSVESGLTLISATLPVSFTGLAVFEKVLVGWNHNGTDIYLLHRFNFEVFQTLPTNSFVMNVFSISGTIGVVTSSDLYLLSAASSTVTASAVTATAAAAAAAVTSSDNTTAKSSIFDKEFSLQPVFHTSTFLILGGCCFNKKWLILTPRSWKVLASPTKKAREITGPLEEEMDVAAPFDTLLQQVVTTPTSTVIRCSQGVYIYLNGNNIQALHSPFRVSLPGTLGSEPESWSSQNSEYLVSNSPFMVASNLKAFELHSVNGQLEWRPWPLLPTAELATNAYLIGESNPSISARFGDHIGTETGSVDDLTVFPGPVLKIDDSWAYSSYGKVKLPLYRSVNLVKPVTEEIVDSRVTVMISNLNTWSDGTKDPSKINLGHCTGVRDNDCISLQFVHSNDSVPAYFSVLLVTQSILPVERVIEIMDTSPRGVVHLEDLAVLSVERSNDALLQAVAAILSHIWESQRVEELLRVKSPRSLKVLASMFGFSDVQASHVRTMVEQLSRSNDVEECQAAVWVFKYRHDAVKGLRIPFLALNYLSDDAFSAFTHEMARTPTGVAKLMDDIAFVLGDHVTKKNTVHHQSSEYLDSLKSEQKMAVQLLLSALDLPAPLTLPKSEPQLVQIVKLIVPSINRRVVGAKAVLVKLLAMHKVNFHQSRQQLLVPTPNTAGPVAIVIDMDSSGAKGHVTELKKPSIPTDNNENELLLNAPTTFAFSADGKTIYGTFGTKRFAWQLPGTLRSMFWSEGPIDPVEVR